MVRRSWWFEEVFLLLLECVFSRGWKPQTWPWFQNSCSNYVREPRTLDKSTHSCSLSWVCLMFSFCPLVLRLDVTVKASFPTPCVRLAHGRGFVTKLQDIFPSLCVAVFLVCLSWPERKQEMFKVLALLIRYWPFKKNSPTQPFKFNCHTSLHFKTCSSTIYFHFKLLL